MIEAGECPDQSGHSEPLAITAAPASWASARPHNPWRAGLHFPALGGQGPMSLQGQQLSCEFGQSGE